MPLIIAKVENGKLVGEASQQARRFMERAEGHYVMLDMQIGNKRSPGQNAMHFGYILPAMHNVWRDYGNNVPRSIVHTWAKVKLANLTETALDLDGNPFEAVKSSADLTTKEFAFLNDCSIAWLESEGVKLVLPNERIVVGRDAA